MSMRYQAGVLTASYFPLKVPNAPTIGTATTGDTNASVTFSAPSNIGGGAITGYVVVASPGGAFNSGASSPITVSGLTNGTAYTFKAYAINAFGNGPLSAASNSVTPQIPQQIEFTTAGTYTWVAPAGLSPSTVSVVCVGGGGSCGSNQYGGGGGGLGYKNNYSVTAGNSYTVVVGAGGFVSSGLNTGVSGENSYFVSTGIVRGGGGGGSGAAGTYTGDGGGNGGTAFGSGSGYPNWSGGGGAGGYAGNGGNGAVNGTSAGSNGAGGGGGGGGGGNGSSGGGGVGLLGQGASGNGGATGGSGQGGFGGSGGTNGNYNPGGLYGGGAGQASTNTGQGGGGAVRIIYSSNGVTRTFPSTNTGDL